MSFKFGVSSFLVFCVVLLLIFKNYEIWTQPIELVSEKGEVRRQGNKPESRSSFPSVIEVQRHPALIQSYITIAEKNVFNPERKDFPIPMPITADVKKPLVRPQIVLYGVTIAGDYQVASIVSAGRTLHKGERETITLKIGEQISNYKLAKISSDRITLETEGDSFEVLLYDPKMPKRRMEVKTEIKPATITSTFPAAPLTQPEPTKPTTPPVAGEVKTPVQERVSIPPSSPSVPRPIQPLIPTPTYRRVRTPNYSPPGTRAPQGTPFQQGTPAPIEEEED
jgi:hypothetical protein